MKSVALLGLVAGCTFSVKLDGTSDGPLADARVDAIDAPSTDAALVDAVLPVDAGPDAMPTWIEIEVVSVPCTGTEVASTMLLQPNTTYRLRASGQCISNTNGPSRADAEYAAWNYTFPVDSSSGVDLGLAVNDTTPGDTKLPDWGSYASSHEYTTMWVGLGAPITVMFHDPDFSNNAGTLSLAIDAFQ
ncbi:MAG: hypothetical protein ACKV2T_31070 [Kofleriaceae bacterium]